MVSRKVVHLLEDNGLSLKNDLVELHFCHTSVLLSTACAFKLLLDLLLNHQAKLLGIVDGILDAFDLVENLLLISGKRVLLGIERLADPVDLGNNVGPGLQDDDECDSRFN